ncbi:hypothetical protein FA95DRAFT_1556124 [Auriscalpium vulgare]|uniref:Uncharacterized protein n=1 Tax=Auriscalpium vulgare TaxID=40419 RepID=A0ACB8S0C3_9AGAM|nr:hypothetical protein FA95DRAFT_1556124 [Auriscalpium vulgare]
MLARTARRRYVDGAGEPEAKRLRTESGAIAVRTDAIRVRRLSVIFSCVGPPAEVDFIITAQGVEASPDEGAMGGPSATPTSSGASQPQPPADSARPLMDGLSALDVELAETDLQVPASDDAEPAFEEKPDDEDDEEVYWREFEEPDLEGLEEFAT